MKMPLQLARQRDPAKDFLTRVGAFVEANPAGVGVTEFKPQLDTHLSMGRLP
jgi:hypothetical protein